MNERQRKLENWRQRLELQDTLNTTELDELESHLQEQVLEFEAKGLSFDESFLVAEHRLGSPEALTEEFRRGDPSRTVRQRMVWAIVGVLLFQVFTSLLAVGKTLVSGVYLGFFSDLGAEVPNTTFTGLGHGLIMTLAVFALAFVGYKVWFSGQWDSWGQRLGSYAQKPGSLLALVLVTMLLSFLLQTGLGIVGTRLFPPTAFGALALTSSYSAMAWSAVLPISLIFALKSAQAKPS